ncbi:MAG: radical SAM protein, partial [Pseudomonadota bacterium]
LHDRYRIRRFDIVDDIFNFERDRARAILAGVRDQLPDCELYFPNGLRGDILDEETIRLLGQARTRFVCIAIETASDRLQKLLKKNINIGKVAHNLRLLKEQGIVVAVFFMVGLPTETSAELEATFALIEQLPLDWPWISIAIPYGNTGLWSYVNGTRVAEADIERLDPRLGWAEGNLSGIPSAQLRKRINRTTLRHFIKSGHFARIIAAKASWWGPTYLLCGVLKATAPAPLRKYYARLLRNQYAGRDLDFGDGG